MNLYKIFIPFASPYVVEFYELAIKSPDKIFKKQTQDRYFRHVRFPSKILNGAIHKLEEYRHPGISYRHLLENGDNTSEQKMYPLDNWIIKKIFFQYFEYFYDEH